MTVSLVFTASAVRLLVSDGMKVKKWASVVLPAGAIDNGLILDSKSVSMALTEAYRVTGAPREPVLAVLSGLPFIHRTINLPLLRSSQEPEALERAARKDIPLPPEETYYVWHPLRKRENEQVWFVAGVPRKPVDALVECLNSAGLRLLTLDLEPLAIARAGSMVNSLILSISSELRQIVLVADGVPEIMHSVPPLAREATLEENIQKLSGDLARTVRFYDNAHPDKPFDVSRPLLVTGDMVDGEAAWAPIRALMGFPAEILELPLSGPADFPATLFAANAGLALRRVATRSKPREGAVSFLDISIDLVAGRTRATGKKAPSKAGTDHMAIVILLALAAIGTAIFFGQLRNTAQGQYVNLQARLQGIIEAQRSAAQALPDTAPLEVAIKQAQQQVTTIANENRNLEGRAKFVYRNLDYMIRFLPPGVRIAQLEVAEKNARITGEATSTYAVISYAQQLQQNPDFRQVIIRQVAPILVTAEGTQLTTDNITNFQMSNLPVSFNIELGR